MPRRRISFGAVARHAWAMLALVAACAGLLTPVAARAGDGFPPAFDPMVLMPTVTPQRWEFDLNPAFERARREHRRLYLYLGADDCPFCRKYEAFLRANAQRLVPEFASRRYLVVDLRSTLKAQASRLFFHVGAQTLTYRDYMQLLGDERVRQLVYPSVWLFDESGRTLMQMPAGTGTFETVPEQMEILNLVQ